MVPSANDQAGHDPASPVLAAFDTPQRSASRTAANHSLAGGPQQSACGTIPDSVEAALQVIGPKPPCTPLSVSLCI